LTATADPVMFQEAVKEGKWCVAINAELAALELNNT